MEFPFFICNFAIKMNRENDLKELIKLFDDNKNITNKSDYHCLFIMVLIIIVILFGIFMEI